MQNSLAVCSQCYNPPPTKKNQDGIQIIAQTFKKRQQISNLQIFMFINYGQGAGEFFVVLQPIKQAFKGLGLPEQ